MENSWIEEFYKETDADKRLELLENNSTDMEIGRASCRERV